MTAADVVDVLAVPHSHRVHVVVDVLAVVVLSGFLAGLRYYFLNRSRRRAGSARTG